jgi:excisionase family DNA binding protein
LWGSAEGVSRLRSLRSPLRGLDTPSALPHDGNCRSGEELGFKKPLMLGATSLNVIVDVVAAQRGSCDVRIDSLPLLLTPEEAGALLRTSRKAIYALVERGQIPGVTRLGRRVLIRSAELLDWLDHNRTPSPQEKRR